MDFSAVYECREAVLGFQDLMEHATTLDDLDRISYEIEHTTDFNRYAEFIRPFLLNKLVRLRRQLSLQTVQSPITEVCITVPDYLCSICIDVLEENSRASRTPCHHYFHSRCLEQWLSIRYTCPYCRASINNN
jgi:hypothetical protein